LRGFFNLFGFRIFCVTCADAFLLFWLGISWQNNRLVSPQEHQTIATLYTRSWLRCACS
jgi:hypothetical protein